MSHDDPELWLAHPHCSVRSESRCIIGAPRPPIVQRATDTKPSVVLLSPRSHRPQVEETSHPRSRSALSSCFPLFLGPPSSPSFSLSLPPLGPPAHWRASTRSAAFMTRHPTRGLQFGLRRGGEGKEPPLSKRAEGPGGGLGAHRKRNGDVHSGILPNQDF